MNFEIGLNAINNKMLIWLVAANFKWKIIYLLIHRLGGSAFCFFFLKMCHLAMDANRFI